MEVLDYPVASNWSQHPHKREEDRDLRQMTQNMRMSRRCRRVCAPR